MTGRWLSAAQQRDWLQVVMVKIVPVPALRHAVPGLVSGTG
jgi:hypothetical protein